MRYENILDIIKNNIQLFNCIKSKFKDGYKIELGFKLDDKDSKELYFWKSIDLKTGKIIFASPYFDYENLIYLNKDIEILIYENLNHLKDILEKHLNINN